MDTSIDPEEIRRRLAGKGELRIPSKACQFPGESCGESSGIEVSGIGAFDPELVPPVVIDWTDLPWWRRQLARLVNMLRRRRQPGVIHQYRYEKAGTYTIRITDRHGAS